jgi:DNA repair protein RecN (Recombination protein N)
LHRAAARTMLDELDIRDFVLAEHLRLRFAPGLNAITGETGAGKSLVIDALGVLLGDRADPTLVRTGARSARIEATFQHLDHDVELQHLLADSGLALEDDGVLIVSREVPLSGRSSARINGRAVVQSVLAAIGDRLVDIHSQTEHLSILKPSEHINYLDRFAGAMADRAHLAETVTELRRVRSEAQRLREDERERARRQERLEYEVEEIEAASIVAGEEEDLRHERSRLANAEQLAQLAAQAHAALDGDGEETGASDALGTAAELLTQLARLDEGLAAEASQIEAMQSQVADLSRTLRAYGETVEFNPERLQQIEERLGTLASLKRKYGSTLDEVLAYQATAARSLEQLNTSEAQLSILAVQEAGLLDRLAGAVQLLSNRRRAAAARLSEAVEGELGDLGMGGGRFAVHFGTREDAAGVPSDAIEETVESAWTARESDDRRLLAFDRAGIDRVEFLVALNPGEPLRPLARVASGGEISRLMLALKTILGAADAVPTLVFDEVDSGVGGRSGRVVGAKLVGLAQHHQVICITHLAQIASLAAHHLALAKHIDDGRTMVAARRLEGDDRLDEVAAMLGGVTAATRASAQELLEDGV